MPATTWSTTTGSYSFPAAASSLPSSTSFREEGGDHRGFVNYVADSDDDGLSWRLSKNMVGVLPVEAQEPQMVEPKDSRLTMLCRTYSSYVVRSYSGGGIHGGQVVGQTDDFGYHIT